MFSPLTGSADVEGCISNSTEESPDQQSPQDVDLHNARKTASDFGQLEDTVDAAGETTHILADCFLAMSTTPGKRHFTK